MCLFDGNELSLRDVMRATDDDRVLSDTIQHALLGKKFAHAGQTQLAASAAAGKNRAMVLIGG